MRRVLVLALCLAALLVGWLLTRGAPPSAPTAPEVRAPASAPTPEPVLEEVEPAPALPGPLERATDPRSPAGSPSPAEPALDSDLASRPGGPEDLAAKYRGVAAADRAQARQAIEARIAALEAGGDPVGSAAEIRRLRREAEWLAEHGGP